MRDQRTGLGQAGSRDACAAGEFEHAVGIDRQAEMVHAADMAAGGEVVLLLRQLLDLREGLIAGGLHLARLQPAFVERGGAVDEGEGLRHDQWHWQAQRRVEHVRLGLGGIFAETEDGAVALAIGGANLEGPAPEDDAVGVDRTGQGAAHQRYGKSLAGEDDAQRLGDFGEDDPARLAQTEAADLIGVERPQQGRPDFLGLVDQVGCGRGQTVAQLGHRAAKLLPGRRTAEGIAGGDDG